MATVKTVLNLLTTHGDELREAFDAIEHPGFFDESLKDEESHTSIGRAFLELQRLMEGNILSEENQKHYSFTIYGDGGEHRYNVRFDGTIEFDTAFCNCMKFHHPNPEDFGFKVV